MTWPRASALAATALLLSCHEYGGSGPAGHLVQLAVSTAAAIAGETIDIDVFYRRTNQSETLLLATTVIPVEGVQQVPVTVDVTDCLNDSDKEGVADRCPLRARLVLRTAQGFVVDSQQVGPFAAGGGTVVTTAQVTLQRIASISLSPREDSIPVFDTTTIAFQLRDPSGAPITGKQVLWRNQSPTIVSVSGTGLVTGLAPGMATVMARSVNDTTVSATTTIVVMGILGVELAADSAEVDLGQTVSPIPTVTSVGAVAQTVTWISAIPQVATVSAAGIIAAVGPGRTVVRVSSTVDTTKRDSIVINVAGPLATAILDTLARRAFATAVDGSGFGPEGQILVSGMMADEWVHSGTFSTRLEVDRRQVSTNNSTLGLVFDALQNAVVAAGRALVALQRFGTGRATDARLGTSHNIIGGVLLNAAMNYCSGIPLATEVSGQRQYGPQQTTNELLLAAIAHFDSALAGAPGAGSAEFNTARVLKARALLLLGQFGAVAAVTAQVPTTFRSLNLHASPAATENGIFHLHRSQKRWSLAHSEGSVGLPFRGGTGTNPNAADPRIPWIAQGLGFDAGTAFYGWLGVNSAVDSQVYAKGEEARLIEAEVDLQFGNVASFLARLNALRVNAGLPPVTDPGTQQARVSLLFAERGFWLFGTGTRLADLRRLMRQYGRAQASVFPTGPYHKGGTYGADVNLPLPTGFVAGSCFDRNP